MHILDLRKKQSGHALVMVLFVSIALMALFGTTMIEVKSFTDEARSKEERIKALYLAEIAVQSALRDLNEGGDGTIGTREAPIAFDGGAFWVETVDNGIGTFDAEAFGVVNGNTRAVQALIAEVGNVFHQAIFAGNVSDDPTYSLELGGTAPQSDVVVGDIYSGQDVAVSGDASITGNIRARGVISGATGHEGTRQPIPDIAGMNYDTTADVDVAAEFAANGVFQSDDAGGDAWQLPATNPAHIFRKNPTDRQTELDATAKDDYFLEDPYETVANDPNEDGSDPYRITLTDDAPGQVNRKVFYIDGNLWIHNTATFSFAFGTQGDGNQITIAVRGNIYISDNMFYDKSLDALALVAVKDKNVADSGNIYFGDPRYGTLDVMNAFMYAENNFHDLNLGTGDSSDIVLNGTMSAGNHVDIQRDFGGSYSKMTVNFDARLKDGLVEIPGIPTAGRTLEYALVLWRRASEASVAADETPQTPTEPQLPGGTFGGFTLPPGTASEQLSFVATELNRLSSLTSGAAAAHLGVAENHVNQAIGQISAGDTVQALDKIAQAKGKIDSAVSNGADAATASDVHGALDQIASAL